MGAGTPLQTMLLYFNLYLFYTDYWKIPSTPEALKIGVRGKLNVFVAVVVVLRLWPMG